MNGERNVNIQSNGGSVPARQSAPIHLTARPVADVYERADAFIVSLDLPGVAKDNIEIVVEPGFLAVRAGVAGRPEENGRWLHREIGWNRFEREFKIGPGIDEKKVEASFTDGVLTITLPKSEESRVRQIKIS
jgi:HSP20 family protein